MNGDKVHYVRSPVSSPMEFGQDLRAMKTIFPTALMALAAGTMVLAGPATAQYRQKIGNNMAKCRTGDGPAVLVTIRNIKASQGTIRVQSYRGTKDDWLQTGKWINRIEAPAHAGTMSFCMPVPQAGTYGIAVRHDLNGNGKTDLTQDGGAMSNNPSLNIFNLGKPSYKKTKFDVGQGVTPITINMRYM